jgi:hypothetical protein
MDATGQFPAGNKSKNLHHLYATTMTDGAHNDELRQHIKL